MPDYGPFAAGRLNPILANCENWAREHLDGLEAMFYEGGYAVGTEKQPKADEYATLVRMRDTGDRHYWDDPTAQKRLALLSKEFGAPPPIKVPDEQTPGDAAGPALGPSGALLQFGGM